jgi:glycosyltransferase involved in cell wall biosynthesis
MDPGASRVSLETMIARTAILSVDAIVPLYNEPLESILVTVGGLNSQTHGIRRIILVDDGSTVPVDYSVVVAASRTPVEVLRLENNSGISVAKNRGARNSDANYFLFVNSGIELLPEWTKRTVDFLANRPDVGLTCGRISSKENTLRSLWNKEYLGNRQTEIDQTHEITWAVGHAVVIPSRCLWQICGWNEQLKRADEDGDLSHRLRELGLKIYQVEGALGVNHEHHTVRSLAAKSIRNAAWSLDPQFDGDGFLRALCFWPALADFTKLCLKRMARNLIKRRWHLLAIDVAVAGCGVSLILRSARQKEGYSVQQQEARQY